MLSKAADCSFTSFPSCHAEAGGDLLFFSFNSETLQHNSKLSSFFFGPAVLLIWWEGGVKKREKRKMARISVRLNIFRIRVFLLLLFDL